MTENPPAVWYLYLVECADGTLYTGITTDVERRLAVHAG
jgi:putative endonuclease